jgi:uncharacterized membrane protein YedE/YeeE
MAMRAPFFLDAIWAALPIGFAFGWFLERGGLGNARKLAAQFYLTDLTVFKVMFSAIVTAALGVFWSVRLGILDLSQVAVPPTFIMPQLVGGLVFGVGFITAGLCPGTSCVAAATGRIDGLAVVFGMFAGVFAFEALLPGFQAFYESTARGTFTLDQLTGFSTGAVIFALTAIALGAFAGAEALEQRDH